MKKFRVFLLLSILGIAACDLQPKITALPDTVGEFITSRYPTLLADPKSEPEIYNSAATDYGVYASPELYGTSAGADDYVLYSSVDDYIVPPQPVEESLDAESDDVDQATDDIDDVEEDFSSDDVLIVPDQQEEADSEEQGEEADDDIAWDENAKTDDKLNIPMYGGDAYTEITVARGDTLYLIGKKYNMTVEEIATLNNLSEPYVLRVGQKLRVRVPNEQVVNEAPKASEKKPEVKQETKPEVKQEIKPKAESKPEPKPEAARKTTTRVDVDSVTVVPGDTLYSLSRKYSVPVNDLAVMNNLSAPFALYAGQTLKIPDLSSVLVRTAKPVAEKVVKQGEKTEKQSAKTESKPKVKTQEKQPKQEPKQQTKQSAVKKETKPTAKKPQQTNKPKQETKKQTAKTSVPKKTAQMPAITARSSSKFTWPVRGKILSNYGAKTNGLFNDGINIAANAGTMVAAAENGVVAYAGNEVKGMGNLVIIQHSDGWMTVYAHMDSMTVRRGVRVGVGQKIGTVGKTGKVDKPQLHFEVRKGTKAYNPIQYLKK